MIGEGVLHECLNHSDVSSVLVINRKSCGVQNEKLKEIINQDFFELTPLRDQLSGYNACYFCMGISAIGMKEEDYRHITYDLTLNVANTLAELNPDMTFCYVSGAGTDSTEKGRSMWARVKGKTENDLMKLPFKAAYMFRPGYIHPTMGLNNTLAFYRYLAPFYPLLKILFPKYVTTLDEIGLAMIHSVAHAYIKQILECKDIVALSKLKV